MAYAFGDGFDLYAQPADMASYWDNIVPVNFTLGTGRFAGSRALTTAGTTITKTSGVNDGLHHFVFSIMQPVTLSGTSNWWSFTLYDGATAQCSVVFRSDGSVVLTSGIPTGTVLATYTGALTATSVWYAFEIEVNVSNTNGYMNIRKNGNPTNDFSSATNLNTRNSANNYANKLQTGAFAGISGNHYADDLLWRSDASSVAWVGDIRCWTRMPASDASVQWTPSGSVVPQQVYTGGVSSAGAINTGYYNPFIPTCDGTIGSCVVSFSSGANGTALVKATIFASNGTAPTTVLGSATPVAPASNTNATFTFGTPVAVTRGTQYWLGLITDAGASSYWFRVTSGMNSTAASNSSANSPSYAAFPIANPTISLTGQSPMQFTMNITPTTAVNAPLVAESVQDAANSYVYSSTNGQGDRYGITGITGAQPVNIVMVTTVGYLQKSDAGTRNAAMQLKSGAAAAVQSTSTALQAGVWSWLYRNDTVDPNTGAAWTASAVDAVTIGPVVTA